MESFQRSWKGDYLFLFENLILKDFRIRYRNMSLGVLWSLINPLVMMSVMTFVFRRVIGGDDASHTPYPLFVLTGLVPFNFFTGAFISGTTSIIDNAGLIKRVPVPREVVPVTSVLSNCVHLTIQIALLLVLGAIWGVRPGLNWLWLPVIWALYVAFVCGLALGASAINVFVRDTRYVVESFNLVLFWVVPIFYSFNIIPEKYREIYRFNPVAALVMAMRNILIEGIPPAFSLVRNLAIAALVTVAAGWFIFGRLKSRFYEHI
ncbi:MAG: ABC transporter permease [Acidobacteriia bacterium]|nr:ABC transporter permease [Terriglobia bacterium]